MNIEESWREKLRKMEDLAVAGGCVPVREQLLVEGDEFRLFVNGGHPNWYNLMTLDETVFVWDGCDGFGYGHEKVSGRKALFTGEDWVAVVKSNVKRVY